MANPPYKKFIYDYRFNGDTYQFVIPALNRDEADERIRCLSVYGQFVGELLQEYRAPRGLGWFVQLVVAFKCWLENRKNKN